ncbi:Lrp/AsnC family transcriptional regulator [Chloroflexota bacterium]
MVEIDDLDKQIVAILGQDARLSSGKIAKQLKVSAATVRRRTQRMLDNGLLRITGVVDMAKFGYGLAAVIALDVNYNKIELALDKLKKQPEIRWVSTTSGRYDIMALARFASAEELSSFLKGVCGSIEGVRNGETFVCLELGGHYFPFTSVPK